MQASAYPSVKGGKIGFVVQNQRRVLLNLGESTSRRSLSMTGGIACCGGLSLNSMASMGVELGRTRLGVNGIFGSSAKPRSLKAQASCLILLPFPSLICFGFDHLHAFVIKLC